ncbi:SLC30A1 [Lepeophtheirus salmonis]|uniref:SLC30A1 n=1 Tax=Lepeophtheirus salmonis TaxID=72036 RepID=A0A7R8CX01_LEPSM|nr:SLC30A1 [Lepeophtheirus salmonis]CAF2955972.1 SLC30A1 [Lepeophtheirus salmonis]
MSSPHHVWTYFYLLPSGDRGGICDELHGSRSRLLSHVIGHCSADYCFPLGADGSEVWLSVFSITIESFKRFYEPEDIHSPVLILFVGTMGLIVNLFGLCLFHEHGSGHSHGGHSHGSHSHLKNNTDDSYLNDGKNKKDTKLDADALGSVVVIVSALIMWLTEWEYKLYVDPGLSLLLVILMMHSVWPLLIESAMILLQTVPTHLDIENLRSKLLNEVEGILEIHDFHIWQLAGNRIIASAHIRCLNLSEYMKVAEKVKEFFHHEGIHSTTIQPEFVDTIDNSIDCALSCPTDTSCEKSKCCLPPKEDADKRLIKTISLEDIPSVVTVGPESTVSRPNDNQEHSQITSAVAEDDLISESTPLDPSSSNSQVIKIVSNPSNV